VLHLYEVINAEETVVFVVLVYYTECVSNVDETLGEMFLEEKTPTEDDIRVGNDRQL